MRDAYLDARFAAHQVFLASWLGAPADLFLALLVYDASRLALSESELSDLEAEFALERERAQGLQALRRVISRGRGARHI